MSILFALIVRLWAAIILSLVGVALVAAPIGATRVEGRKPSTRVVMEGRKAPTLSSFRRARKARRSPHRGAWLKRHPHAIAFRGGEVAKRRPRTETKALGRAIGRALEATDREIAHLRAKRAQGRVILPKKVLVQAEPMLAPKVAKVKAISARALRRAERSLQMHRGSGAVNRAARKAAWYNNSIHPVELSGIEILPTYKVDNGPATPKKVAKTKQQVPKARATELKANKAATASAVVVDIHSAYEARQKAALKANWDAATFVVAQARKIELEATPRASSATIEKRAAARIREMFKAAMAGVMYLGQELEGMVDNTSLVGILLVGVLVILARKEYRKGMAAEAILTPSVERNGKRQQGDKVHSRALRAARKAAPFIILAALVGLGGAEEGLLFGGIFTSLKPLRGAKWMSDDPSFREIEEEMEKEALDQKMEGLAERLLEGANEYLAYNDCPPVSEISPDWRIVVEAIGEEGAMNTPWRAHGEILHPARYILEAYRAGVPQEWIRLMPNAYYETADAPEQARALKELWSFMEGHREICATLLSKGLLPTLLLSSFKRALALGVSDEEIRALEEARLSAEGYMPIWLRWASGPDGKDCSTLEEIKEYYLREKASVLDCVPQRVWRNWSWIDLYCIGDLGPKGLKVFREAVEERPEDALTLAHLIRAGTPSWLARGMTKRELSVATSILAPSPALAALSACDLLRAERILEEVREFYPQPLVRHTGVGFLSLALNRVGGAAPVSRKEYLKLLEACGEERAPEMAEIHGLLEICKKAHVVLALAAATRLSYHQLWSLLIPLAETRHTSKWLELLLREGEKAQRAICLFPEWEAAGATGTESWEDLLALATDADELKLKLILLGADVSDASVQWHSEVLRGAVPGPLSVCILAEMPGYRLRVLEHDDLTGPCLGYVVTCCQKFRDHAQECAEFGATKPWAGFVVVEKKEKGDWRIIAQSFYWKGESETGEVGLCFDNVEYRAIEAYVPIIRRLYSEAAEKISTKMDLGYVTLGTGYVERGSLEGLEAVKPQHALRTPDYVDGSDALHQVYLSKKRGLKPAPRPAPSSTSEERW